MEESIKEGVVEALLGGFYYISVENAKIECRARGNFRNRDIKPAVGDQVALRFDENTQKGYIVEVFPRKNKLVRPPVANVDVACIVCSISNPKIKMELVEKFLFSMRAQSIETWIILTKTDLISDKELAETKLFFDYFISKGIRVFYTNQYDEKQAKEILSQVKENQVVLLTGQTGVGKTTFLNNLGFDEQTQEISKALGRGKHTTRAATFYHYDNRFIVDTPGFSSFDLQVDSKETLAEMMYQFIEASSCKFRGCLHNSEPNCTVKLALENGEMPKWHYEEYLKLLKEVKENERY